MWGKTDNLTHSNIWVITYFTHMFVYLYLNMITTNNNRLYTFNNALMHCTVAFYTTTVPVVCTPCLSH